MEGQRDGLTERKKKEVSRLRQKTDRQTDREIDKDKDGWTNRQVDQEKRRR
jgi:hypothetical protein